MLATFLKLSPYTIALERTLHCPFIFSGLVYLSYPSSNFSLVFICLTIFFFLHEADHVHLGLLMDRGWGQLQRTPLGFIRVASPVTKILFKKILCWSVQPIELLCCSKMFVSLTPKQTFLLSPNNRVSSQKFFYNRAIGLFQGQILTLRTYHRFQPDKVNDSDR